MKALKIEATLMVLVKDDFNPATIGTYDGVTSIPAVDGDEELSDGFTKAILSDRPDLADAIIDVSLWVDDYCPKDVRDYPGE